MSLAPGSELRLRVEKPAAGGWMIARANGQVILVSGAIPGETVVARVERTSKAVVYARVVGIDEASPDRRDPFTDPLCGGCRYAHVAYPRQLEIKSQVIADAFERIARVPVPAPVVVAASPTAGYRMRARLHVRGRRIGFFREGTHDLCDARATRQLLPATTDVLDRLGAALQSTGTDVIREVEVAENIDASQRVLSLEAAAHFDPRTLGALAEDNEVSGVTLGQMPVTGDPYVMDTLPIEGHQFTLRRHVQSFFQANRFVLGQLVAHVVGRVPRGAEVVDFYAGVGLFSVAAARAREARVVAVEGDRVAARDLAANASQASGAVQIVHQPVESFVRVGERIVDLLIVDPPRTGMSRGALDRALALRAPKVVYVSCDVATLARDVRRFVDGGYRLTSLDAFDLFPNTPHVESGAILES